jgi:hypothetical protein
LKGNLVAKNQKKDSVAVVGLRGNLAYQLKITLKDINPPIWRRIQVCGDITLYELHTIIQTVMDWLGHHPHVFNIRGLWYADPLDGPEADADESKSSLDELNLEENERFFYVYDFGDSWEHEILLEKILPIDEKNQYPICLTGKRSGPPDDCGGAGGYLNLLNVLNDPNHPDYNFWIEWVGTDFYPESFDIDKTNLRLKDPSET